MAYLVEMIPTHLNEDNIQLMINTGRVSQVMCLSGGWVFSLCWLSHHLKSVLTWHAAVDDVQARTCMCT
jgi:hypothetical protein